ncbi:MCE family protein [Mycobacterium sp. MAA66]|uniref:MCE family protein n=1 Tax=Mycobacterium sp. MAA66 TaxID=3156297 RepID=UPI003517A1D7
MKRPIESYDRIFLAVVAVAVVSVLVAVILLIEGISPGQKEYRGEFAQAASLRAGDQVTIAGIPVGAVSGLQLAGDRVIVEFKLDNDIHLGSASRAAIKLTTLLGSRYLELSPSPDGELPNRTITLPHTQVPYDLQQTLADATTTFEEVDVNRLGDSLTALAGSLRGVPQALPQALDNLNSLSSIIVNRRDQIGTLLASTDKVTTMIRNQKAALGALVLQGRDLFAAVARRRAAVERLFAGATALVEKTKSILDDEPQINAMLTDLSNMMGKIRKNDALLRSMFQVMPPALRNLTNATGTSMGVDLSLPMGPLIDSWLCAISARGTQFLLPQYFKDCAPAVDPWPGWPGPEPLAYGFPGFPAPDTPDTPPVPAEPATNPLAPVPSPQPAPPAQLAPPPSNPGAPNP